MNDLEDKYDEAVCKELAKSGTKWHFSPPGAPHMNGLAESAVKSIKLHLKRTIADNKLTFEELSRLLAQIEACVNSRPLCRLSSDPNDLMALTTAHFLVGQSLILPPEECHIEAKATWLNRWQKVQQLMQYFWKRWQFEYLNQLQTRTKWYKKKNAPELDDHPGDDGLTRVVSLKTNGGITKRLPLRQQRELLKYDNIDACEQC
ncbi:uncharacterized protein LOC129571301 [Sitodiplosis mosellana]|uniref:uncharacterized protein LOC129571301 n=1 Tax=Sitodiplosis mosellana TaxID=263140 RepID=UPI00244400A3|nr:uncharacterized protein LOC129571301 [Sitodiplosis mosellana]